MIPCTIKATSPGTGAIGARRLVHHVGSSTLVLAARRLSSSPGKKVSLAVRLNLDLNPRMLYCSGERWCGASRKCCGETFDDVLAENLHRKSKEPSI